MAHADQTAGGSRPRRSGTTDRTSAAQLDEDAPPGTDWMARTAVQGKPARQASPTRSAVVIRTGALSAGAGVLPKTMLLFRCSWVAR